MSLYAWPIMLLAILAVVGTPVGTYLLWNRVRGPHPAKIASRMGMIGLCQFAAIMLCAVVINNHYQLYASWNDLMGDNGGPGVVIHGNGTHENAATGGERTRGREHGGGAKDGTIKGGDGTTKGGDGTSNGGKGTSVVTIRPAGPPLPLEKISDGTFVGSFTGPKTGLGGARNIDIWLPPQYNDPAYAKTDFPVVMLFPGFPGSPQTWFGAMGGQKSLEEQMAQRDTTTPFVLVAVNISPEKGTNTNCSDIPNGPQVATFITEDVRPMLQRTLRVSMDRSGWGMMGYSEGGLCAGKLLAQYPQYFSAAVQMSGDINPDGVVTKYGPDAIHSNSTLWLLQNHPAPASEQISLLAAASREDGNTFADAMRLQQAAPGVVDVLLKDRGAHNLGVWKSWLPEAYTWLSQHLAPATPRA